MPPRSLPAPRLRRRFIRFGLFAAALGALAGCGADDRTLAPVTSGLRSGAADPALATSTVAAAYPVALGGTWEFRGEFKRYHLGADGSETISVQDRCAMRWATRCTETLEGTSYAVQEIRISRTSRQGATAVTYQYDRLRGDHGGLYEFPTPMGAVPDCIGEELRSDAAGVANSAAPGREGASPLAGDLRPVASASRNPGGPLGSERVWLEYPLHVGATWQAIHPVRAGTYTATVEGRDVLDLPAGPEPAWRIRYRGGNLERREESRAWLGAHGFVQFEDLIRPDAVAPNGNPVGDGKLYRETLVIRRPAGS